MTWRDIAACRGEDPELFFPASQNLPLRQVAKAKAVCCLCPARAECLEEALAAGIDAGIWGGMTEQERRELRKARAAA